MEKICQVCGIAPATIKYCKPCAADVIRKDKRNQNRVYSRSEVGKAKIASYVRRKNAANSLTWKLKLVVSGIRLDIKKDAAHVVRIQCQFREQVQNRNRQDRVFYHKIFQPSYCIDCGVYFETLYPEVFLYEPRMGTKRCPPCRRARRQSTHGGDARRCFKNGVPYDGEVNRTLVLERDNYTCWVCNKSAPKELRGTYDPMAPEVDHIHPLGAIIDGKKSPGHVWSNVRCIHRTCNTQRNKNYVFLQQGALEEFHRTRAGLN